MEMIALCRVMAILHFKICMPMRWLAGNTHSVGAVGYDWSSRSMGKAIDAIHDIMVTIENDGSMFMDENFMNSIFNNIYTDEDGNDGPLEPLVEAMKYKFEDKITPAVDGSKVLPYDQLNAELFYPDREENKATTTLVEKMAVELAVCMLQELRDPKKATSDYLSSEEGKFSWGETTEDEHQACMGKMATNDPAESPFATLTQQLQSFGRVLGIHASAIGQARINGDFHRDIKDENNNGAYLRLPKEMHDSLLRFAIGAAPQVRKAEKVALDKQRARKDRRKEILREKKLMAAQREYANALTYIDMYHSSACWKTSSNIRKEFSNLTSMTAKKDAMKEQINIRVLGFGWDDLHHPWSKGGVDYTPEQLRDYLIATILPEQKKRTIPAIPSIKLPSRGDKNRLGTKSKFVEELDRRKAEKKKDFIRAAKRMRDDLDDDKVTDRYEKLQGPQRCVDETLLGDRIEILFELTEPDGSIVMQWCQGVVVGIKKGDKVHIEWNKECLRDGELAVTEEKLLKSKWNKHVEKAWRMDLS